MSRRDIHECCVIANFGDNRVVNNRPSHTVHHFGKPRERLSPLLGALVVPELYLETHRLVRLAGNCVTPEPYGFFRHAILRSPWPNVDQHVKKFTPRASAAGHRLACSVNGPQPKKLLQSLYVRHRKIDAA
jgi:hypothetical protein